MSEDKVYELFEDKDPERKFVARTHPSLTPEDVIRLPGIPRLNDRHPDNPARLWVSEVVASSIPGVPGEWQVVVRYGRDV